MRIRYEIQKTLILTLLIILGIFIYFNENKKEDSKYNNIYIVNNNQEITEGNTLYIPSADILAMFAEVPNINNYVDSYDVVISNNVIRGNNYRSFKDLNKAEVDSYIYMYDKNRVKETYQIKTFKKVEEVEITSNELFYFYTEYEE